MASPSSLLLFTFPQNDHHFRLHRPTTTKSFLSPTESKPYKTLTSSSSSPFQIPLKTLNPQITTIPSTPTSNTSHHNLHSTNGEFEEDPLPYDYLHLLRLSVRNGDYKLARAVHASIFKFEEDTTLFTNLINAYSKLECIVDAQNVFDALSSPDVVSYTSMISAYGKFNREEEAIELFFRMRCSGIEPNAFTFVAILTACHRVMDSGLGFQIHSLVIKMGYLPFVYVSNALMSCYVKWGYVDFALKVFGEMSERDLASWNTVILGLVKDSQYERAFEVFRDLLRVDGFRVDYFTISSLLTASKACFSRKGQEIHAHALRIGLHSNVSVNNALIGFYTICGSLENLVALFERMPFKDVVTWTEMVTGYMEFGLVESAVKIFYQMPIRNVVSYNALLAGFCQNREGLRALELFEEMLEEGMELTDSTLTSTVNACALLSDVGTSKQIHGFVIKSGLGSNAWTEAALLDMCTKCGRMDNAQKLFSQSQHKHNDPVPWTSMICGYARNEQPMEALSLFCVMHAEEEVIVDEHASTAVLSVCGTLGFHEMGKQVHCLVIKCGFSSSLELGNAIVSMYSKCGSMEDAVKVFSLMPKHNIVSFNGLITGHLLHRNGDRALAVWSKIEKMGLQPDSITFTRTLSAHRYTSVNSVDSCRDVFQSMRYIYGIEPTSDHLAAMVSVLGHWGCFEEAEEMVNRSPSASDTMVWRALLDSCRMRSNTRLGTIAAKHLLAIEPQDPSTYILVSNLYSASGRWHCSERVREEMRAKGLKKNPAQSWIIHQNTIHSFYARDNSHSQTKDIYSGLDILILECLKAGYVPDTSFVLHEVEEYQKKDFLYYHSAKLAVAYGLLMTKPGKVIRVMKNIHLCGDCHTFFKYVTNVTGREICLRDSSGFHCFRNGECSCKD